MRTRDCSLHLRLTEKERDDFRKKAERAGVNAQTYFGWILYDHPIREAPPIEYQEVLRELRQINSSMNEIAEAAERTNHVDAAMYRKYVEELQKTVGRMMEEVYG